MKTLTHQKPAIYSPSMCSAYDSIISPNFTPHSLWIHNNLVFCYFTKQKGFCRFCHRKTEIDCSITTACSGSSSSIFQKYSTNILQIFSNSKWIDASNSHHKSSTAVICLDIYIWYKMLWHLIKNHKEMEILTCWLSTVPKST